MIDDLYSTAILRLAANLPRLGRLAEPDASVERVARPCGSRVVVDVVVEDGVVTDFAQEVRACALGQATAGVLGAAVVGARAEEVDMALAAFRAMLQQGGPAPEGRFSDLAMLAPVKDHPHRHASSLLAFEATAEAVRLAGLRPGARTMRAGVA